MIVPPQPVARRARPQRERRRFPLAIVLLVLLAALLVAGGAYLLLTSDSAKQALHVESKPPAKPVQLQGVGAYDPEGDGSEHGEDAHFATDHNPGTSWETETYRAFQKGGVGLVLQAPQAVALKTVDVHSVGTDFEAQIKAGASAGGPFTSVSGDFQPVGQSRTFSVDTHGKKYRYYVVWLRLPSSGGQARISEVTAKT